MADRPDMKNRPPQRFPRVPEGIETAELGKRAWTPPEFEARQTKNATEFVFRLPFSKEFRKENLGLYRALFERKGASWARAVKRAYSLSYSGEKPIYQAFNTLLYTVFTDALAIQLVEGEVLGSQYVPWVMSESEKFRNVAPRKGGLPKRNEQRAIDLAIRYGELLGKTQQLRQLTRSSAKKSDQKTLEDEVNKILPFDLIRRALAALLASSSRAISMETLMEVKWAPWKLALRIMECEEADKDKRLAIATIEGYIKRGNELLSK